MPCSEFQTNYDSRFRDGISKEILTLTSLDKQQDSMDAMPKTRSLFGLDGMNGSGHVGQATSSGEGCAGGGSCFSLERGYVATPICCPSRSSYLTGKYIHNTGTLQNSAEMGCSSAHWVEQEEPRACE